MSSFTPLATRSISRTTAHQKSFVYPLFGGNHIPNRSFARGSGGGFHGPTSRGMGRDGGGRGPGGPRRTPQSGKGRGRGPGNGTAGRGGGFADFRARRAAAIERDLEAARAAAAAAAGSKTPSSFGRFQSGGQRDSPRSSRQGPNKPNFDEDVLRPASRGQLQGDRGDDLGHTPRTAPRHSSGIPKLAARKRTGHSVHDEILSSAAPAGTRRSGRASVRGEMRHVLTEQGAVEEKASEGRGRVGPGARPPPFRDNRSMARRSHRQRRSPSPEMEEPIKTFDTSAFLDDKEYDSDEELEPVEEPNFIITPPKAPERNNSRRRFNMSDNDPITQTPEYKYLFRDVLDFDNEFVYKPTTPKSDALLQMRDHGDTMSSFLGATMNHPSKYAVAHRINKHPDSKREPRPIIPNNRIMPDEDYLNQHKGFLYVMGLVPQMNEDKIQDFADPLHKQTIAENVAKLFGVSSVDVSPATPTSAFIGFPTKEEAKQAMINCVDSLEVTHPTSLEAYTTSESDSEAEKEFASVSGAETILKVTHLPVGLTSAELTQTLFPPGSKLESLFGPFDTSAYFCRSPTTALLRLPSPDLVEKALASNNISSNASALGRRSIQVLRAKRERVFDGWTGPNRAFGTHRLGNRLIVHGDIPPHKMHLSHHDVLYITGLPPSVTPEDLATFFQPFCAEIRDVYGSGHIVRCSQGHPTGTAYVGFEYPGEMDQLKDIYKGRAVIGGAEVRLRPVLDKLLRRGVREGARPTRPLEELERDLNDWERHVDPEDIALLEKHGIEKSILAEVFINLRHNNRTFAAIDQAIPGERLYKERQIGSLYKSAVRKYIKILKECLPTEENPGMLYEAMFPMDSEIDLGLMESERKRISELRKRGI